MSMYLVADIGGTNARFALIEAGSQTLLQQKTLPCAKYPTLLEALQAYLDSQSCDLHKIKRICLAVAGPVEEDIINLPNNHWEFSRDKLVRSLDSELIVINDFTAQMYGVLTLSSDELQWLGSSRPRSGLVSAAIGPGTGLGVAGITPGLEIIPSEGGHLAFAPVCEHEVEILRALWKKYPRASVERLLSGPGLSILYHINNGDQLDTTHLSAATVTELARAKEPAALQTLTDFISILGSVAGEVAIGLGARGGVYLTGGILPKLAGLYDPMLLRERFNSKGRFTDYCSEVPLAIVLAENNGLKGCVYAANNLR
jgi:glucokinase